MMRNRLTFWPGLIAASLFAALFVSGGENAAAQTFAPGAYHFPQYGYMRFRLADVNGDGRLDLVATTSAFGSSVSVALGVGDGTFAPAQTYATDNRPYSITIADVNGDGKLDILTANPYVNSVSVLLGKGDGTFQAQHSYTGGADPTSLAVADINGDGIPDLIASNAQINAVSVLLGNGDGTFQAHREVSVGGQSASPYSLAVADVNGDGIPDIITRNWEPNSVSVLLGKGDGTFQTPNVIPAGDQTSRDRFGSSPLGANNPYALAVADVNGDGSPDILTANEENYNAASQTFQGGSVSVLLSQGDGTFGPETKYAASPGAASVSVGDLNGDGRLDLVVAGYGAYDPTFSNPNPNYINIFYGNGDGTFQPAQYPGLNYNPDTVVIADVNGDGKPDILASGGKTNVLLNQNNAHTLSGSVFLSLVPSAPVQNVAFTFRPANGSPFTRNAVIGPDGRFALGNVPAGSYAVHIKSANTLAKNVSADLTVGDVSDVSANLPAGDANNDNRVDVADFGALVNAFGGSVLDPTSGYDPNADFNGDGTVDIADFSLLVGNYGMTGDL